jgi:hypothetical protein
MSRDDFTMPIRRSLLKLDKELVESRTGCRNKAITGESANPWTSRR